MLSAFGTLLPIALAVAVSSVPITLTILILLSPKRNQVAIPFLIGWVVGTGEKRRRPPGSEPGGLGVEDFDVCYVVLVLRCRVRRLVVMVIAMNAGTAAGILAFGRYPLVGSSRALPQRRRPKATRAERHERDTPGQATPRRARPATWAW